MTTDEMILAQARRCLARSRQPGDDDDLRARALLAAAGGEAVALDAERDCKDGAYMMEIQALRSRCLEDERLRVE